MEQISKSEAARRWKVSPAAVTKYVRGGCPVRNDGQLDWEIVKQWHRDNVLSHRSGSFKSRLRAAETMKRDTSAPTGSPAERKFFADGIAAGYFKAWDNIRHTVPALLSEMSGDNVDRNIDHIAVLALVDFLLEEWFSGWRDQYPDKAAPIDWAVFKNSVTPADAERTFTNFQKIFAERAGG